MSQQSVLSNLAQTYMQVLIKAENTLTNLGLAFLGIANSIQAASTVNTVFTFSASTAWSAAIEKKVCEIIKKYCVDQMGIFNANRVTCGVANISKKRDMQATYSIPTYISNNPQAGGSGGSLSGGAIAGIVIGVIIGIIVLILIIGLLVKVATESPEKI